MDVIISPLYPVSAPVAAIGGGRDNPQGIIAAETAIDRFSYQ